MLFKEKKYLLGILILFRCITSLTTINMIDNLVLHVPMPRSSFDPKEIWGHHSIYKKLISICRNLTKENL